MGGTSRNGLERICAPFPHSFWIRTLAAIRSGELRSALVTIHPGELGVSTLLAFRAREFRVNTLLTIRLYKVHQAFVIKDTDAISIEIRIADSQ